MGKVRVGIDINEVLRAKWIQFDRYYAQEFGEEGIPKNNPYVFDYFNEYDWKDVVEIDRELKEPEDIPEHINPIDYQINDNTGEAPADFLLFKKEEHKLITAKQVYNRFLYEDYLFEVHGAAPQMYKDMDTHVNKFYHKYCDNAKFSILSVENRFSIPPTLFFLSKISCRFSDIRFVDKSYDMWNDVDILITTDPFLLKMGAPWGKKIIKVIRPYNENIEAGSMVIKQIFELIDNPKFEKLIKFKK